MPQSAGAGNDIGNIYLAERHEAARVDGAGETASIVDQSDCGILGWVSGKPPKKPGAVETGPD
jgi:hypothetical protein